MTSRYEITDHEWGIRITESSGVVSEIGNTDGGEYLDDAVIGAIRQQQADIAALKELLAGEVEANEAFRKAGGALDGEDMPTFCSRIITEAEIGRKWLKDSSLAAWFPLTAERIGQDAQEIAKLRARLAAIEAAPAVITVTPGGWINLSSAIIPYGTELVARPAKDAP